MSHEIEVGATYELTTKSGERRELLCVEIIGEHWWGETQEGRRFQINERTGLVLALSGQPASQERCRAGSDGDCSWAECPQEANNRENYQQWCPLAEPASQEAPRG